MGEGWFIVSVLFTLSLIYKLFNRQSHGVILKIAYLAAIYAGIVNSIAKFIFNRQRPSIGVEPLHFFYFFISKDKQLIDLTYAYNSMPSGHTITIFAAILPLILYVNKLSYKIMLLSIGIVIAIARIYTINHWFSDISMSILLGFLIGYTMYSINYYRLAK